MTGAELAHILDGYWHRLCRIIRNLHLPPERLTIMAPTVGRIVHFHPSEHDSLYKNNSADFHAAIITQVWAPSNPASAVNMIVFPAYGPPEVRSSVGPTVSDTSSYWSWPPRDV